MLLRWRARSARWQGACTRRVWSPSGLPGRPGRPWCTRWSCRMALRVTCSHQFSHWLGELGSWSAASTGSPHSGQRPPCRSSRRRVWLSSGGLMRRRRAAQYSVRAGSSGDAVPLTVWCRAMFVQENLMRWAMSPRPLTRLRSPKTHRSFLNLLNLPKCKYSGFPSVDGRLDAPPVLVDGGRAAGQATRADSLGGSVPVVSGWRAQAARSSGLIAQGRNRSRAAPVGGLPPAWAQACR